MHRLTAVLALCLLCGGVQAATNYVWWQEELPYRVPVVIKTAGVEETDAPVQVRLNFSAFLPGGEQVDPASVHVVEQDARSGAFLRECPALLQPVDDCFRGLTPINFQKPYDPQKPPLIRASSENPEHPARGLIDGTGFWEAGTPAPPWSLAVDLGEAKTVNCVLVRPGYSGTGQIVTRARVETSTDSTDGLTDGTWEPAGRWDEPSMFLNGFYRPFFFAPRPARFVRVTLEGMTSNIQPTLAALQVFRPLYDPDKRQEERISWYVPGKWSGERQFFVYCGPLTGPAQARAIPQQVAIFREAEESLPVPNPSGVGFGPSYDKTASGPSDPNLLTYDWQNDSFIVPTAWAVTLPRDDTYTIAMRVRGNPGDHQIAVLWDRKQLFAGTFGIEGQDWNMVALQPLALTAGVHTLELMMKKGQGARPLDLDLIMLTTAPKFLPNQVLLAYPGAAEVRK
jgi:hypothetical protein